jgi:hypothetical protein
MVDLPNFSETVRRLFQERPEVARICEEIATYVFSGAGKRKLNLTLSLLRLRTRPRTDKDLLLAIQYLTGAEAELLEPAFAYLDQSGEQLPIDSRIFSEGPSHAAAYLGVEYASDEEFESRVLLSFVPTAQATEVARRLEVV